MVSFGISTWSIHRLLERDLIDLLDVPAELRRRGMSDLQICHFHFKSRDADDLRRLRTRMEDEGVTLDALLLDFGDLSCKVKSAADAAELARWLEVASTLGARHARISAGHGEPNAETLARSASHLLALAEIGDRVGVRVITENWHAMVPSATEIEELNTLTRCRVPLCLDFGNWSGPDKYAALEKIASLAVTVHAKCAFQGPDEPDAVDFARCCSILKSADYSGTIALIYDGPSDDEWRHLELELRLARAVFDT